MQFIACGIGYVCVTYHNGHEVLHNRMLLSFNYYSYIVRFLANWGCGIWYIYKSSRLNKGFCYEMSDSGLFFFFFWKMSSWRWKICSWCAEILLKIGFFFFFPDCQQLALVMVTYSLHGTLFTPWHFQPVLSMCWEKIMSHVSCQLFFF